MQNAARSTLALLLLATPGLPQTLDWTNFEERRDAVLPRPDEERWLAIRWHPTFWEGVRVAQEEQKPILLWAMNGHPLGCT